MTITGKRLNGCMMLLMQSFILILTHAEIRFQRGRIAFVAANMPRNAKATKKGKHDSMIVIFKSNQIEDDKTL